MKPRTPPSQIFYEQLNLETSSPLPFIPFIVGKTLPDADYESGPYGEEKNSFNIYQFEYITSGVFHAEIDGKNIHFLPVTLSA